MKDRILQTLAALRDYARAKGVEATFLYHEEDSTLMRFANSAISLNTNEHLIRLQITAYQGRQRASYGLITGLGKLAEMQQGVDIAAEMVKHAQPLSYQPTVPAYARVLQRRERLRSRAGRAQQRSAAGVLQRGGGRAGDG